MVDFRICDIIFDTMEFFWYPSDFAVSFTSFTVSFFMRAELFKARETALFDIPSFSAICLIDTKWQSRGSELFIFFILHRHGAASTKLSRCAAQINAFKDFH